MMTLAWPWALLLLPVPWIIRRWAPPNTQITGKALRIPFFKELMSLSPAGGTSPGQVSVSGIFWTGIVIWIFLVVAAARPQWVGKPVSLPVTGRDLLMAVDISGSMEIPDFTLDGQEATRLDVVKTVAGRFIARRSGDRVGLILFGSRAYLQTPLTFDRTTVRSMLNEAKIGMAGRETSLGDAIGLAIKRLNQQSRKSRVLVLLTDGANTSGEVDPLQAAKLGAEQGVRIYTLGVGAERMEVPTLFGTRSVNPSRDLDEETLKKIAELTGGVYQRAKDTEGLEAVYQKLDTYEPAAREKEVFRPVRDFFIWPLGAALLCSVLLALWYLDFSLPFGRRLLRNSSIPGLTGRQAD